MAGIADNLTQSLAQGLGIGLQLQEQENLAIHRKRQLELATQANALDQLKNFNTITDSVLKMPSSIARKVAPAMLAPYIDSKSDEGKAFLSALVDPDPEARTFIGGMKKDFLASPVLRNLMTQEDFIKEFSRNPISTLKALSELDKAVIDAKQEGNVNVIAVDPNGQNPESITATDTGAIEEAKKAGKVILTGSTGAKDLQAATGDFVDEKGNLKTAVSGEIRRFAAVPFGGVFNPLSGEITGLDTEGGEQFLAVASDAEAILKRGEATSTAQAVAIAFQKNKALKTEPKQETLVKPARRPIGLLLNLIVRGKDSSITDEELQALSPEEREVLKKAVLSRKSKP